MNDQEYMGLAIEVARRGVEAGQSPFGSVIVRDGTVVAAGHNTVWKTCDPTAHAEVNTIRAAAAAMGTIDLSGTTLYSTCEPCPMCLTAIHWAKIDRVVYGAEIEDAERAGFSELRISAKDMVKQGGSPLRVDNGVRRQECAKLFDQFLESNGKVY